VSLSLPSSRSALLDLLGPTDAPRWVRRFGRLLLREDVRRHLAALGVQDAGYGYDTFGAHPDWVRLSAGLLAGLYDHWFRVVSRGAEHIPSEGAVILAANHSGTLPYDGAMIWLDVLRRTHPPRLVRPVADHFVAELPFFGTLFARAGTVGGSRGNVAYLLDRGEILLIFPEGAPAIGKTFSERYQLMDWRVGHVEAALRHGAAIVPVGVVGAEEQMPNLARLPLRVFGSPFLPVPLTPVPLPVRYHLRYGPAIHLGAEYSREQADDPVVLRKAAQRVREAVERLISQGLSERPGVFA
jgi:1-acyl-sn-glycerol-3-phosphate acyltransferase